MWQEENGITEMLFTYLGRYGDFSTWGNWRRIVVDILSCHEEVERQRRLRTPVESVFASDDGFRIQEEEMTESGRTGATAEGCMPSSGGESEDHNVDISPPTFPGQERTEYFLNVKSEPVTLDEEDSEKRTVRCKGAPKTRVLQNANPLPLETPDSCLDASVSDPLMQESSCQPAAKKLRRSQRKRKVSVRLRDGLNVSDSSNEGENDVSNPLLSLLYKRKRNRGKKDTNSGNSFTVDAEEQPDVHEETTEDANTNNNNTGEESADLKMKKGGRIKVDIEELPSPKEEMPSPPLDIDQEHVEVKKSNHNHTCSFCPKSFPMLNQKKVHERVHTGERPYVCSYCFKTFSYNTSKVRHERIHTGEKPFSCSYCPMAFIIKRNKNRHERTHTGERPFQCPYCIKTFRHQETMRNHERSHTGEKPYPCTFCGKAFKMNANRLMHERIHTGEKPFACSFCSKRFRMLSHRKEHERIHTREAPYQCRFCPNKYRNLSGVKEHTKTHTGERPYVCRYCPETFLYSTSRKLHEKNHSATGEEQRV